MLLPYYQPNMLIVKPRYGTTLLPMSRTIKSEFLFGADIVPFGFGNFGLPFKNNQVGKITYTIQLMSYSVHEAFIDIKDGFLIIEASCSSDDNPSLLQRIVKRIKLPQGADYKVMSTDMHLTGVLTVVIAMNSVKQLLMLTEERVVITELTGSDEE